MIVTTQSDRNDQLLGALSPWERKAMLELRIPERATYMGAFRRWAAANHESKNRVEEYCYLRAVAIANLRSIPEKTRYSLMMLVADPIAMVDALIEVRNADETAECRKRAAAAEAAAKADAAKADAAKIHTAKAVIENAGRLAEIADLKAQVAALTTRLDEREKRNRSATVPSRKRVR
jgi:hypothetical protein